MKSKINATIDFILEGPLPPEIKDFLVNPDHLKHWNDGWLGYVYVFQPAYPDVSPENFMLLNTASYLSARAVYAVDHVFDLQVTGKAIRPKLVRGHYLFSESQRLLSRLFPLDSPFWCTYYQRMQAHYAELELSEQTNELTEERYHRLLQCKYALTYIPLDALHFLTGKKNPEVYNQLVQAMHWFILGYNIPNEVDGLHDDVAHGINNYAYWRLMKVLEHLGIPTDYNPNKLQQLLYATRLGETLHDEAVAYLEKARSSVQELSLPYFIYMIDKRLQATLKRKSAITGHIEQVLIH